MKEYSDENTDIRRITLKRKNVGRHCGESFKDRMPDSSGQEFFATDYFDVMSVERKSIADDFTDIMGVCAEDAVVDDEVSVQSFVLYENGIRCLTENPFDFFIRHQTLDCRMAEVLTTSAGERHFPTIHRMLLSRTPIKEEHIPHIIPHLYLNSSNISINKDEIQKLAEHSLQYQNLIEHLLHNVTPVEAYNLKEDYVLSNASQFLSSKEETRLFLSELRNASHKMRYNKVSNKLDETVRELLLSLGYYKNPDKEA